MKVKKIIIKQELLDIPYNKGYKEVTMRPLSFEMLNEGELLKSKTVTDEIIYYEVRQVFNGKEKEDYLVKVNDIKIFDDLLKIGSDDINRIISEITSKNLDNLRQDFYMKTESQIKRLESNPLWRRILKKYK